MRCRTRTLVLGLIALACLVAACGTQPPVAQEARWDVDRWDVAVWAP